MKISTTVSRTNGGYALIITLAFLAVALIAYASLMNWVSTNAKITKRNNLFNQSQGAAESATEIVLGTMIRDFQNQSLNSASSYAGSAYLPSQTNWPITFTFSTTNGLANATSVTIGPTNWSQLPSQFFGLYGLGQTIEIASQATPQNVGADLSATVYQNIWFGSIPVFQFAIFYNMDLEINPGKSMTINGRVHSNNNIYATGSAAATPLIFSTNVEAALQVYQTPNPLDPNNYGSRSGNVSFLMTNSNPQNPLNNAESLSLPIGTNNNPAAVLGILGIPPTGIDPASPTGQSYIYNLADIIVSNSATYQLSVYYQNLNNVNHQTLIPCDITNIVSRNTNTYYSFVTNVSFYDYRESDTVKAVQLDVAKFNKWLTNPTNGGGTYRNQNTNTSSSKGHDIDGIYIYNAISTNSSQIPAVRVVNGQQLPTSWGLSVATQFPLYIMGDFNTTTNGVKFSNSLGDTTNTYPSAIMGDAITILSSNWSDTNSSGTALTSRNPVTTCINAACLEGIVPSNGTYYSGGVENFLRLLENWSASSPLSYNGSIVVLFPSQYATSPWQGGYYGVPTRAWGFDTNFRSQGRLPPMTPQVRAIIRGAWATW